jgi:hypothetical protein
LIYDTWKIHGILKVHDSDSNEKHHPFKSSHGFRKFFQTNSEKVIKSEDIEILIGHGSSKRGLKGNYYRPSKELFRIFPIVLNDTWASFAIIRVVLP